jgi:hypothetical protein
MIPKQVDKTKKGIRPGGTKQDRLAAAEWIEKNYHLKKSLLPGCLTP